MNAVYVRVSTEEQAKTGYSLADQIQSCRDKLISLGFSNIKEYIDDGYSGEYLERPALDELRNDIRAKIIENICIYDPDRLSRNLTNQLLIADEIEKANISLYFVTGDYDASPEGRLFFSIRGAISAFEKAKIKERTQRGRKSKAESGKIVHNAKPYGYTFDKEKSMYVINDEEAKIVRMIYDMCINNGMGARTITFELAKLGIKGRKDNKPLSINCVERVLTRDLYYGQHYLFRQKVTKTGQKTRKIINVPREDWIPINVPAIIDIETYQKAQEQRQKNKLYAKRNTVKEYLLQGVIYCGMCFRGMISVGRPAKRKNGPAKTYYYYTCVTKESANYAFDGRCNCRRIPAKEFDELIWNVFVNIANGTESLDKYLRKGSGENYSLEITKLEADALQLNKKRSEISSWFKDGLIDANTAKRDLKAINYDLSSITAKITSLRQLQAKTAVIKIPSAQEILNASTFQEKQTAIRASGIKVYAVRLEEDINFYFA